MKMSIANLIQIARFMLFVIRSVRQLVVDIEQEIPEPKRGVEKFETVKKTLLVMANYMGISAAVLETVDGMITKEINDAVAEEINNK